MMDSEEEYVCAALVAAAVLEKKKEAKSCKLYFSKRKNNVLFLVQRTC